jgi:hypothetical protein
MRLWEWLLGRLGGDLLPADLPEVRPEGSSAHDLAVRAVEAAVLAERERGAALAEALAAVASGHPYDWHSGETCAARLRRLAEAMRRGEGP